MGSEIYNANSPLTNSNLKDKFSIDLDEDITLCDTCENVILKPYVENNKLICTKCGSIYDSHYELVQVQNQETILDELTSQGEMSYKDDSKDKPIRITLNHSETNLEDVEYINKELERYEEMEIIDEDKISTNKNNRHSIN